METTSNKKKILILDKNGRMLSALDAITYFGNFDVHLIYDPNAIYDKAKVINPDLIILDYLIPDNDCALICQDFKDDERLKGIPIIILTTFKTKKAQENAYNCDALFIKPLDMEQLASRMEYLIAS